jgi:thiamine transporter ThiT
MAGNCWYCDTPVMVIGFVVGWLFGLATGWVLGLLGEK